MDIKSELNRFYQQGIISGLQLDYMLKDLEKQEAGVAEQPAAVSQQVAVEQVCVTPPQTTGWKKAKPDRKPVNVQKVVFTVIGIIAAVLIGSALVNLVAANWFTMSIEMKMLFAGFLVAVACVISFIAFKKDHFVWLEGGAIYAFATAIAVSAIISQAIQSQTSEAEFLRVLLPVAVLITLGFNSKILYFITSGLFVACSVANDYKMWWIIAIWVIFYVVKSVIERDKSPFFIASLIAQCGILAFGFTHSFIDDPTVAVTLLCVTAFVYDRVWVLFKRRQSDDYPDKSNAFRVFGIILFFVTVGPVFSVGYDTEHPYWLVGLPMLAMYGTVAVLSAWECSSCFTFKLNEKTIGFPIIGFIPLSVVFGMAFAHVHPVLGAMVAIIPVLVAFLYFGNRLSNNGLLWFGLGLTVYLSALTVLLSEGDFLTRAIFGAVTGGVLLLLNWGVRKYVVKQEN